MARTHNAGRLTEAHRLTQLRVGAVTIARMRTVWPLLDPTNLDGTFDRWLRAAVPIVSGQRAVSARLAGNYYTALRTLLLGPEPFVPTLSEQVSADQLATSLLVTGPASLKANMRRGALLGTAVDLAEASSARAATRYALDGGRETIVGSSFDDPRAQGWSRVTSGRSCAFCDMLAGRGIVYSEASADFASHDHCHCAAEPAFDGEQRAVREYVPTVRDITDADRARVRDWIATNPKAG